MTEHPMLFLIAMVLMGYGLTAIIFTVVRSAWRRRASQETVRVSGIGPRPPQVQTQPRMEGLTGRERLVVWHLAEAWNTWLRLERRDDFDDDEMMNLIHQGQALVGMRVAVRVNPEIWRQPGRRVGKTAEAAATTRDGDVHLRPGSNPPPPRPSTKVSPNSPWPAPLPTRRTQAEREAERRLCAILIGSIGDTFERIAKAMPAPKPDQAAAAPSEEWKPGSPHLTPREVFLMRNAWYARNVACGDDGWINHDYRALACVAPGDGPAEITDRERWLMRAAWNACPHNPGPFCVWLDSEIGPVPGHTRARYLSGKANDALVKAPAAPTAIQEPGRPDLTNRELWLMRKAWAAGGAPGRSLRQWLSRESTDMASSAPGGPSEKLTERELALMKVAWDGWSTTLSSFGTWINELVFDLVNGRQVGPGVSRAQYLSMAVPKDPAQAKAEAGA